MHAIIAQDLPIVKEQWTVEKAKAWYAADGQLDKPALFRYRSVPLMTMYGA